MADAGWSGLFGGYRGKNFGNDATAGQAGGNMLGEGGLSGTPAVVGTGPDGNVLGDLAGAGDVTDIHASATAPALNAPGTGGVNQNALNAVNSLLAGKQGGVLGKAWAQPHDSGAAGGIGDLAGAGPNPIVEHGPGGNVPTSRGISLPGGSTPEGSQGPNYTNASIRPYAAPHAGGPNPNQPAMVANKAAMPYGGTGVTSGPLSDSNMTGAINPFGGPVLGMQGQAAPTQTYNPYSYTPGNVRHAATPITNAGAPPITTQAPPGNGSNPTPDVGGPGPGSNPLAQPGPPQQGNITRRK
jgi:hypothetical protein